LVVFLLMNPPMSEIGLMAGFLTVTAIVSTAAGWRLPPGLDQRFRPSAGRFGRYTWRAAFFNVWFSTPDVASQHDLATTVSYVRRDRHGAGVLPLQRCSTAFENWTGL
jgi:hypothetical protein